NGSPRLLQTAGFALPLIEPNIAGSDATISGSASTAGLLAYTTPFPNRIGSVITAPDINIRPAGDGRLVLQCLDLDPVADAANPPSASGEVANTMLGRLRERVEGAEAAQIEEVRVGQRVKPVDGVTAAGFMDGNRRL